MENSDPLKCPICGSQITEEDSICPHCGSLTEEPVYDIEDDLEFDDAS
jgi:transcription initiation factor TFIIIB Brf1 subunit/transcription initiation factor TFIIB